MIIIDDKLKQREAANDFIKVGIIGCGEMGKGLLNQITRYTPGIRIASIFNRNLEKAQKACAATGIEKFKIVESEQEYEDAVASGVTAITNSIDILCESKGVDILVEATGTIEFALTTILRAFENGIHVLSFNAEVDSTFGPLLKYYAEKHGVKYSVGDGDQPGVTMNVYRYVQSMGFNPLLCGNIKGLQDHYRNPTTQKGFAAQWDMTPEMVTSFADGTKISFEQACIANATGMRVAQRGMYGYNSDEHVDNLTHLYDVNQLKELGGIVDYIVGAKPGPGIFIYATTDDPIAVKYLRYGKLGEGPLYSFYYPYHLLFFEIGSSIARMIDFDDTIIAAKNGLEVEVVATAKVDMQPGDIIDGLGGYKTYGICENFPIANGEKLLPMGLAEGCHVRKPLQQDQVITWDDIDFDPSNTKFSRYREQLELFHK